MSTFKALYERMQAMDINAIINAAIDDTLPALEDINRERMNDGLRADGSVMPVYSYISQKVYGYPDTPIKLKATGAFQAALTSKREGEIIHTFSTDSKADMLEERYGEEYGTSVFGTSGEYRRQYQVDHLVPHVHRGITSATGLKFKK